MNRALLKYIAIGVALIPFSALAAYAQDVKNGNGCPPNSASQLNCAELANLKELADQRLKAASRPPRPAAKPSTDANSNLIAIAQIEAQSRTSSEELAKVMAKIAELQAQIGAAQTEVVAAELKLRLQDAENQKAELELKKDEIAVRREELGLSRYRIDNVEIPDSKTRAAQQISDAKLRNKEANTARIGVFMQPVDSFLGGYFFRKPDRNNLVATSTGGEATGGTAQVAPITLTATANQTQSQTQQQDQTATATSKSDSKATANPVVKVTDTNVNNNKNNVDVHNNVAPPKEDGKKDCPPKKDKHCKDHH